MLEKKTSSKRYQDTIEYIESLGESGIELSKQIKILICTPNLQAQVGSLIGLGFTFGTKNTKQRHSLRALLLCQYVFLSDIWKKYGISNQLPLKWKDESVKHWGSKTEKEINEAIAIYMRADPKAFALADIAEKDPGNINSDVLKITRENFTFTNAICYQAVMYWLFKSGFVSYQWLLKFAGAKDKDSLTEAFGHPPYIAYKADDAPLDESKVALIPRGNFIHLYCIENARWNGHWMVSSGGGKGCGCNNDPSDGKKPNEPDFKAVGKIYSNNLTIIGQFKDYKSDLASGKSQRGIIDYYDPAINENFF